MLGERILKRWQRDEGTWAGGTYAPGSTRYTTIRGTWRPLPGRQVQLLEEGDRMRDPRVLYTHTNLLITDQHDNQPPDLISPDDGATYYELTLEFDGDEPAFSGGVRHWKYLLLRLQETEA